MINHETDRYKIEKKDGKYFGIEKEHKVLKDNDTVLIQDISNNIEKSVLEGFHRINAEEVIQSGDLVAIKINLGGGNRRA